MSTVFNTSKFQNKLANKTNTNQTIKAGQRTSSDKLNISGIGITVQYNCKQRGRPIAVGYSIYGMVFIFTNLLIFNKHTRLLG